jgi:hypothetical protein
VTRFSESENSRVDQTAALLLAGLVILVCLAFGLSLRTVPRATAVALAAVLLMPITLRFAGPDDAEVIRGRRSVSLPADRDRCWSLCQGGLSLHPAYPLAAASVATEALIGVGST